MTILVSAEIGRSMKNIRGAEKAVLNFIFIYFKWCSEFKKKKNYWIDSNHVFLFIYQV